MSLLKLLKIGDNHLKDFGDLVLALEHSHSLKNLSADHNEFKKMNLTHIVKLTNLWHLDLSWNKISVIQREVSDREFEVRSGLVEKESNLEILYLGTNLLTSFPNFCREDDPHVSFLPKLRELGIQWNCITAMLPHEMKCLKNLLRLNMDGNAVHHIHANFFQRFPALEHLSLKFCMSRKIDSHAFNHSNVKHLDVSENLWFFDRFYGLGIDPGLFLDMPQLRFVNMSWTVFRFSEYDEREEVLSSISHVTHLSLEGTGLDFIPRTILRDFTHLHYLDYSKNDLTNLPDDTFDNLTQLHKLNLNQNHLTTFTPALLQHVLSHDNVTLDLSDDLFRLQTETTVIQILSLPLC
nr:hypothetical protein BaRGS_015614 [Batillaria attramentaria]